MNDATWTGPRCEICGRPIRSDNTIGICRKTAACRRARMDHHQRAIAITTGQTFGRWTALEDYRRGNVRVRCRCECGTEQDVDAYSLRQGTSTSCGCGRRKDGSQPPPRKPRRDGTPYVPAGSVWGHLTVLEDAMSSADRVLCRCDCGTVSRLSPKVLRSGHTKSCGHLRKSRRTTHGLSSHPLYGIWHGIIQRTTHPKSNSYPSYGGRGITICERWRDVRLFIEDIERNLGDRPTGWSLNRIDNDGNYEPSNVEWAPPHVQTRNRRKVAELECEIAALRAENAELRAKFTALEVGTAS